jgi:hypothetical protein
MSLRKPYQNSEKSKVWDLVLLKENGTWEGFRAPETALRKTIHYIVLLLFIASFSLVGWLWSRWSLAEAESELALSRLELRSLRSQVDALRKGLLGGDGGSSVAAGVSDQLSFLPSLDEKALVSEDLSLKAYTLQYDARNGQLGLAFEIEKAARSTFSTERLFWVLLLHAAHGVQAFPPVLVSRAGAWLLPQKGQVLEGLIKSRKVDARFRAQGFFDSAGTEPVYGTLLIYDTKGSLILKRRSGVEISQVKESR